MPGPRWPLPRRQPRRQPVTSCGAGSVWIERSMVGRRSRPLPLPLVTPGSRTGTVRRTMLRMTAAKRSARQPCGVAGADGRSRRPVAYDLASSLWRMP
ncbi:hypothetical protein ATSB10_31590 [Dyella thiooxydans]|uniref:Uncharacterized protein n=1 Tax=Dyella thiooxydans TaxID=445710 RepID=A0A160N3N7_9GAMM|nr:hypothetical protein ATSB10_31590 [Dyella thiooxydans]